MKNTIKILIAAVTLIMMCSFGNNRADKIQRRRGVMNLDEKGKVIFIPLGDWKDFKPVNDTVYQYKVS